MMAVTGRPVRFEVSRLLIGLRSHRGFEKELKLFRIHRGSALLDVDELRMSADLGNGLGGGDEGVRDCDDGIPFCDAGCRECESERVRTATHADAEASVAKCGELALQALDHRAANETSGLERLLEGGNQALLSTRHGELTKSRKGIFASFVIFKSLELLFVLNSRRSDFCIRRCSRSWLALP